MKYPEQFRVRKGPLATTAATHGPNGLFFCARPRWPVLRVLASDATEAREHGFARWEHVSVSLPNRCPTWEEMCWVKSLFWDDEEPVMQLHPPRSQWVNNHAYCLHLWRPCDEPIPLPPDLYVGNREFGTMHK